MKFAYLWLVLLVLCFAVACGGDDDDDSPLQDTNQGTSDTGGGSEDAANVDLTQLEGKAYRFTVMQVVKPQSVSQILNTIWEQDIKVERLNVIFFVESIDVDAGTVMARAGAGGKEGDNFVFLKANPNPPNEPITVATLNLKLDGLCFSMDNTDTLFFPSEVLPKPLEIENLKTQGCFKADLSSIESGSLSGAIDQEKSKETPVEFMGTSESLFYYLDGANEPANSSINGKPAYEFSGVFSANAISNFTNNL